MSPQCFKVPTLCIAALALLAGTSATAQVREAPMEKMPGVFDSAKVAAERATLSERLVSQEGEEEARGLVVEPTAADLERMANASQDQGRLLVGVTNELSAQVRFDNLNVRLGRRAVRGPAGGILRLQPTEFTWYTTIRSAGASAVRLHFTDTDLPKGAEMFVYARGGEAFGPYTGTGVFEHGEFWSNALVGDEVRLQIHYSGPNALRALYNTKLNISDVVHLGERFLYGVMRDPDNANLPEAFCSFNASCVQNASCSSIPSAIQPARNAVAHLQFVVGSSAFICSGGLLNDTDSSTTIPYLLTANHCFSTSSSANSLQAFFQFSTSCGGSCFNPSGAVPTVNGSTLKSTGSNADYTLVQLNSAAPAGSTLLGWTSAAVAFSNGTALFRVHHPKGAPQAYSTSNVSTTVGTCSSWPRGDRIYQNKNFGATEGGSSGSPVMNSSGQVVGQLSGACGTDPGNACGSAATVDGAFAAYFSSVSQFLDPPAGGGGCHVGANGGGSFCTNSCKCDAGEGDCDSDAQCNAGLVCATNVGPNYGFASWVDVCETPSSNPNSCVGNCGSQAPGGCWCDSACSSFGDCCSDKFSICG